MVINVTIKNGKVYLYDKNKKVSRYYKYNQDISLEDYKRLYLHNKDDNAKMRVGSLVSKKEKEMIATDKEPVSNELKRRVSKKKLDTLIDKISNDRVGKHRVVLNNGEGFDDIDANYHLLGQVAKDKKDVLELSKKRSYLKPLYSCEIEIRGQDKATKADNVLIAKVKLFNVTPDEVKGLLAGHKIIGYYFDYVKKKKEEGFLGSIFGTDNVKREHMSGTAKNIILNFSIAKGKSR